MVEPMAGVLCNTVAIVSGTADWSRADEGFSILQHAVRTFGSALGAMDHGGPWLELDEQGNSLVRSAFESVPALHDLLPELSAKVRAGASVADDGYEISDQIAAARLVVREGCPCLDDAANPYPWTPERHVGDPEWLRILTVRCRRCGRTYEVEEDPTPALHTVSRWVEIEVPEPEH